MERDGSVAPSSVEGDMERKKENKEGVGCLKF